MTTMELRRVGALRAANIAGIVTFALYSAITILMAPFFLIILGLGGAAGAGSVGAGETVFGMFFMGIALVVYPILGAVFGWIGGGLSALVYNFVVRWTGGLELEFEDPTPTGV